MSMNDLHDTWWPCTPIHPFQPTHPTPKTPQVKKIRVPEALSLLEECPLLHIEDLLPHLPDLVRLPLGSRGGWIGGFVYAVGVLCYYQN